MTRQPSDSDPGSPGHRDVVPMNRESIADESTDPVYPTGGRRTEQVERVDQSDSGIERRERIVNGPTGLEHREEMVRNRAAERQLAIYRAEHLIGLFFGCVEVLIGIRVVLHLLGANIANPFANIVFVVSDFFLAPFFGLVGSPAAGRYVLEIPSIIAIVVYALIAWGLVNLLQTFAVQATTRTHSTFDRYQT